MNTFNSALKNKEIQCERLTFQVHYFKKKEILFFRFYFFRVENHMHQLQICMIPKEEKVKV
jgi:hypothetical protein